jgi:hypothetical protein
MLCRNGDAVPEGHEGQTANLAWWRELHCDRKSSLFAAQLGHGNHLHHDRAKEAGSSRSVARGPEKVSLASLPSIPSGKALAREAAKFSEPLRVFSLARGPSVRPFAAITALFSCFLSRLHRRDKRGPTHRRETLLSCDCDKEPQRWSKVEPVSAGVLN